jgi:hypothetical protein
MGVFGDGGNAKKSKRGAANVEGRLAGLGKGNQPIVKTGWVQADPAWVAGIVVATTELGGMVSFVKSRDGGAVKLTIFLDSDKRDIWISGSEDLNAELEKIWVFLDSMK